MNHYRKTRRTYEYHNSTDLTSKSDCPFPSCNSTNTVPYVYENDTMYIIPNRVSYDVFEGRPVLDHLMVIPKRHVETIGDFTDQEKIDQMTINGTYEAKGYNIYARSVGSTTRSVRHQHTHLIKCGSKSTRAYFFIRKPYFLVKM